MLTQKKVIVFKKEKGCTKKLFRDDYKRKMEMFNSHGKYYNTKISYYIYMYIHTIYMGIFQQATQVDTSIILSLFL